MAKPTEDQLRVASPFAVNLSVWASDANYVASYNVYESGELISSSPFEIQLKFSPGMLEKKLDTIDNILSQMSKKGIWSKLTDPIGLPPTELVRATYVSFMENVVIRVSFTPP